MSFLGKTRSGSDRGVVAAVGAAPAPMAAAQARISNGLKDFLWLLSDVERGRLLDLGPVSQATVNFFTGRGFKVYTEDVLRSWKEHLRAQEQRFRAAPPASAVPADPAALAESFLASNLLYADETFHAILAWDIFDYLDAELLPRVVARLHAMLRLGGVLLAMFHSKPPVEFHHYRVLDQQTLDLAPAAAPVPHLRTFQNREMLNLFGAFRSSKTYVGRDQLREGLFTK